MKYLTINLANIRIKGDADDTEQLHTDIMEHVMHLCDAGTLQWNIDWDNEEDDEDN